MEDKIKWYWWLFILAVFMGVFADKIDSAIKADKELRKVILVFGAGTAVVILIGIMARLLG